MSYGIFHSTSFTLTSEIGGVSLRDRGATLRSVHKLLSAVYIRGLYKGQNKQPVRPCVPVTCGETAREECARDHASTGPVNSSVAAGLQSKSPIYWSSSAHLSQTPSYDFIPVPRVFASLHLQDPYPHRLSCRLGSVKTNCIRLIINEHIFPSLFKLLTLTECLYFFFSVLFHFIRTVCRELIQFPYAT